MPYTYPHTIENGAGERLTSRRRVPRPSGDRLEVENRVSPGAGPPMHAHLHQEEALTVQEGRIVYQRLGEPEQLAGPGTTAVFKAGEAHKFRNAGQDVLRVTGYIEPADNLQVAVGRLLGKYRRYAGAPEPVRR